MPRAGIGLLCGWSDCGHVTVGCQIRRTSVDATESLRRHARRQRHDAGDELEFDARPHGHHGSEPRVQCPGI